MGCSFSIYAKCGEKVILPIAGQELVQDCSSPFFGGPHTGKGEDKIKIAGGENGTGVPCHVVRSCHVKFRRLFCLATRVCPGGRFLLAARVSS